MRARDTLIHRRATGLGRKAGALLTAFLIAAVTVISPLAVQRANAAVALTVTPLTWNIVGLDSNNPATGPNRFPVGARVCVPLGSVDAGAVTAAFSWDSVNPNVQLRPGSLASIVLGSIASGTCADAYFEVEINKAAVPAPYDTTRRYHITATDAVSGATGSTPQPRELYVEHLISQNRNGITSIKLNGSSIPAGGAMTLVVGNTYDIELAGYTATQGYNQLEGFINFPNTIFQTLSVNTTYSADTSPYVTSPDDRLYSDACLWENDPNSPNYRSCVGGDGKAGGTVVTTYRVKIISGAGTSQTLNSLLYDFSGSSYHYNADFSVGFRIANVVGPSSVTMSKTFTPKAISPGGISTMTFKVSNPTTETFTGVNFSDAFPTGLKVAAAPVVSYSGCGPGAFSPAPVVNATSLSFSGGTLGPNSVCTISVTVTAPAGTYDNTTGHLFIDSSIDTGNVGEDTLAAAAAAACIPGQTLASWTVPNGTTADPPDTTGGLPSTKAANVSTATASASVPGSTQIIGTLGQGDTTSWKTWGYKNAGQHVQFAIDTSKYSDVAMSFYVANPGGANGPSSLVLSYDAGSGFTNILTIASPAGGFTLHTQDFTGLTSGSGTTTFRLTGSGANNDQNGADLDYDNVTFTGCAVPAPAPTISKAFAPATIVKGAASTLSLTISNTAPGNEALTGVAFADVLPAGLSIAGATVARCGGTLTTTAATRTIALTGGQLGAGGTCTFSVTVTGTTEGQYQNVTGFVSSTQSGNSTNYATDTLTVNAPPTIGKAFSPDSIRTGDPSTLAFTIANPNRLTALSGITFTDPLPSGVTVVTSGPTTACGGSLATTAPGSISFTGGSLAANTSCTFSVTVTGATSGSKANTTSAITSTEGGAGNEALATLVVIDPVASIDLNEQVSSNGVDWFKFVGVPVGGDVFYRFTVYNGGDLPLTGIVVGDPGPVPCIWTAYLPLAPGATAYCVTGPIPALPGLHPDTATATGTYPSGTTTSSPSTATYGTTGLTIAKSATETYFTAAGNVLHYSYVVTNSGFAPLLGPVTVADDKSTDESCPAVSSVGDHDNYLDPGESVTCVATYTVQAADVTAGLVTNLASALVSGVTSNTAVKTIGLAALTITKSADLTSTAATGPIVYTITVTNTGHADLTGVTVTDLLTGGATFVSGDVSDPGVLDAGEIWVYSAAYTVTQADLDTGTPIVNSATVDTDQTSPSTAAATTTIRQGPGLRVAKSSTTSSVTTAGQVVPYTFTLTNTGNVTLTGITVADPTCTSAISGPTGDTGSDGRLGLAEVWVYTCNRTVSQAQVDAGGSLSNTVTADSAETAPVTDTLDIPIRQGPGLRVAKSITSGARYRAVGDVITYEYRVLNTGNVTLGEPVSVHDDRTTVRCPAIVSLAPGDTVVCTSTYLITQADLDAGTVRNTATATATFNDAEVQSATASVSASIAEVPPTPPPTSTVVPPQDRGDSATWFGVAIILVLVSTVLAVRARPRRRRGWPTR
jgi:uncharacterized repeat protein (TIGR01451 family)